MNINSISLKHTGLSFLVLLLLSACASQPKTPYGAAEVREKLTRLEADATLANQAPIAIKEAEEAVAAAEQPQKKPYLSAHLVWVANHKVDIASAQAQTHLLEAQRKDMSEARETARLDSRTREADNAHQKTDALQRETDELQRQIAELNAKATERGLVVTLGDLLFETNKSELKAGAATNLAKLSAFLTQYSDRTLVIEGHTDNIGSEDYNMSLSERRAGAVQRFLINQGIASNRLTALGKGKNFPVADNDSATGRQLNRRVEVIIANPATSSK